MRDCPSPASSLHSCQHYTRPKVSQLPPHRIESMPVASPPIRSRNLMALTRNEIRKRLAAFAKEQQGASNERSQAQTFWLRFYECFGIRADSTTIYEQSVKQLGGA